MKNIYKPGAENSATYGCANFSLKRWKAIAEKIVAISLGKKRARFALIPLFSVITFWAGATTYYSKDVGDANVLTTWGTNSTDGSGTSPANFTTSGDIFILRAASNLTTDGPWTTGNNVTLQIIGTLTTGENVTIIGVLQLDGTIAVNGADDIFQIAGVAIFTNPTATQVSLAGAGTGNNFTFAANSTLKTVNVNGVSGNNCSLPADANKKNIQFSPAVNFEFNGTATQATLGLPGTLDNLTINNPGGVNLNNNVRVTETLFLTNGIFNIASNTLTLDKEVTITAGSLNAASGTVVYNKNANTQTVVATNYGNLTFTNFNKILSSTGEIGIAGVFTPGTATGHTITGSTINFNGAGSQTIPAFNYNNLTSSNAGARTLAASGVIGVAGTFTPGSNAYTITASTINFNGAGAQTIPAFNYNNLTSSNTGARTLSSTGEIGVAGAYTPGSNSYTVTGSTIDFNGTGAQTIPAFNYNNLTSSNTGARILSSTGEIGVAGTFTPGSNAYTITSSTINFNGTGAQTISAFNYNNLTSSNTGIRTLSSTGEIGVAAAFTPGANSYTVTGSTVNFNGAGPQTIPAFNYNNLTSSNTGARTLAASGSIGVAGTFIPGSNAYTITTSTINFNGTGIQTIPAFNYNNLISSSTGARTLSSTGDIGVAAIFTPGSNAYTVTGSTVVFNAVLGQTIPAFNYNNLTVAATSPRGIVLASTGTIGISGIFTPNTASNSYTTTGSTVDFNGSGAQTIPTFVYNNLITSNAGVKTLFTLATANGNLTINNGTILTYNASPGVNLTVGGNITLNNNSQLTITDAPGSNTHNLNLNGDLTVNTGSAFSLVSGDDAGNVIFTKAGDQTISGGGTVIFRAASLNKSGVANRVLVSTSVTLGGQTGLTNALSFSSGTWEQTAGTLTFAGNNSQQLFGAQGKLAATGTGSINVGGDVLVAISTLQINTTGVISVGGTGNRLEINTNGNVQLQNGTVNVGGRLFNNASNLTITGGALNINTGGLSLAANAAFEMLATSNFSMSNGAVVFQNANANTGGDLLIIAGGTKSVSGGTIQFGNASTPTSQTFKLNSAIPLYDILVNGSNSPTAQLAAALTGSNNITINAGGTLNANNQNITSAGNFSNNGTFTAGNGTVTFNGLATQTLSGGATAFNNLTLNNTSGLNITGAVTVNGILNFQSASGLITPTTGSLTMGASGNITNASSAKYINGKLARMYSGVGSKDFPIGKGGNYRPLTLNYTALDAASTVAAEQFETSIAGNLPPYTTLFPNRQWNITQSGASSFSYDLTLDGTGFTTLGDPVILKDGTDPLTVYPASFSSPFYTSTGLTSFSNFALASQCIPPTINAEGQPQSQTKCVGDPLTFSVTATGPGSTLFTYQWRKGGVDISGATGTSYTINSVTTGDAGSYDVVVSRPCGESTTSNAATLTVNIPPAITSQPSSQTVCEGENVTFTVGATGTGLTYQWKKDGNDINGETNSSITLNDVTVANSGAYTVVVSGVCPPTVTSDEATLTIHTAPTVIATNITGINNDVNTCAASVAFGGNVTSTGIPDPTLVYRIGAEAITSPHVFPVGTTTVTVEATNECGTVNTTFDVTVTDNEPPVLADPADKNLNTDAGQCYATVTFTTPVASDPCGTGAVTATGIPANNHFTVGITTVTWSVTDNNGNTTTQTQNVTVTDNEAPSLADPSDVGLNTDAGHCYATVTLTTPVASDPCGTGAVTATGIPAGNHFPVGITTITWSVTDNNGNTTTQTQNVTVTDNEAPSLADPADKNVNTDAGECYATVTLITPVASDPCGTGAVTTTGIPAGNHFPVGITTVTWSVTDNNGNTTTQTQNVTVTDNEPPSLADPGDININADAGQCYATVILTVPVASDPCGAGAVTGLPASNHFPIGTTTVTWSVMDNNGNTTTQTQNVTVTDNQMPTITAPANVNTNPNNSGCSAINVNLGSPVTSDNCGTQSVTNNAPLTFPLGSTTVTWTVTDIHGNTNTAIQTVTVTGTLNAGATAGTINCNGGSTILTVNAGGGGGAYTYSLNGGAYQPGNTFSITAGTYTVTVKDNFGCTANTNSVFVPQPSAVTVNNATKVSYNGSDLSCATSTNGQITVTASGGSGALQYSKDNGANYQAGNVFGSLSAGSYQIKAKDANGCVSNNTISVTITAPSPVTGTITSQTNTTCTTTTGAVTVTGSGGTGTLQYSLDGGSFGPNGTFTNLSAGNHTVVVKDANGCMATVPVTILQGGVTGSSTQTNVSCFGAATGSVTVTATGGTAPYKYQLNSPTFQNMNTFTDLAAGNYTITIKDKKGCTGTVSVTITQPPPTPTLVITLVNKTDVSCKNGTDGMIQVTASGGTAPYKYQLNAGALQNSNIFSGLVAGTYTVTVQDATGCTNSISVTIKNGMVKCSTAIAITSTRQPASTTINSKNSQWLKVEAVPNPTTTEFTLLMHGSSSEKVEIVVTDMYGKKVHQAKGSINSTYKFGDKFASGMYIVQVIQGTKVQTIKLIKGH